MDYRSSSSSRYGQGGSPNKARTGALRFYFVTHWLYNIIRFGGYTQPHALSPAMADLVNSCAPAYSTSRLAHSCRGFPARSILVRPMLTLPIGALLTLLIGLLLVVQGLVGLAAPDMFVSSIRFIQTPPVVYLAAVLRVVFGIVLVRAAPSSRLPKFLRVFGFIIGKWQCALFDEQHIGSRLQPTASGLRFCRRPVRFGTQYYRGHDGTGWK